MSDIRLGSMITLQGHIPALRSALLTRGALEFIHLIWSVSQLLQIPCEFSLLGGTLLRARNRLTQPGRPTHEDFDILLLRARNHLLQQVFRDKSFTLLPAVWWVVKDVECSEAIWVLVLQLIELLLEQNILLRDVAKNKRDLRLILRVLENSPCELPHGRYTCAAGNEGDVVVFVRRPGIFWDWAFDVEGVAGFEGVDVLGHGAVGVLFDDEVEEAAGVYIVGQTRLLDGNIGIQLLTFVAGRGIRFDRRLLILRPFELGDQRTCDAKAADSILVLELEPKLLGVVVDVEHLVQSQRDKALIASLEDFRCLCRCCSRSFLFARFGCWCSASVQIPRSYTNGSNANCAVEDRIAAAAGLRRLRCISTSVLTKAEVLDTCSPAVAFVECVTVSLPWRTGPLAEMPYLQT